MTFSEVGGMVWCWGEGVVEQGEAQVSDLVDDGGSAGKW
jgi:hypothetical protein